MVDIGYKLSKPIEKYCSGEIYKDEFKQRIQQFEQTTDGANWWTISAAVFEETSNDEECLLKILDALVELYPAEDLVRIFSRDLLDQVPP